MKHGIKKVVGISVLSIVFTISCLEHDWEMVGQEKAVSMGKTGNQLRNALQHYISLVQQELELFTKGYALSSPTSATSMSAIFERPSGIPERVTKEFLSIERLAEQFYNFLKERDPKFFEDPKVRPGYQTFCTIMKKALQQLEQLRELCTAAQSRSDPNLNESLEQTYAANFALFPQLNPKTIYEQVFNISPEEGMALSSVKIKEIINTKINDSSTDEFSKRKLRQVGYLFKNKYTKYVYDTFLKGPEAVKHLQLDDEARDRLFVRVEEIGQLKHLVNGIQKLLDTKFKLCDGTVPHIKKNE